MRLDQPGGDGELQGGWQSGRGSRISRDRVASFALKRLTRQLARMDAFAEHKCGADCTHDGGAARPAEALADAIHAVNAGAVCTQQIRSTEAFELVGGPVHLRVGGGKEMKTAENGINRLIGKFAL